MKTTKIISDDLLTLADLCSYYGLSESTIRRRIRAARNGTSNFPLPLFSSKSRVLFRKVDVLSWAGEDAEVITFTPSPIPSFPKAVTQQIKSHEQIRKGLEALGVRLPPPLGMKPAPANNMEVSDGQKSR
jgi:predicted DNA-binding transcriptional regulator AlpA